MQTYSEIARLYLETNNPSEVIRLQDEGKLEDFLADIEDEYDEQETFITMQMTKDLPDDYLARVQSLEQAKRIAREQVISDLTSFLRSLEQEMD